MIEQTAQRRSFKRPRIRVLIRHGQVGGLVKPVGRHANRFQRDGGAVGSRKFKDTHGSIRHSKSPRDASHRLRRGIRVVLKRMRQNDRVHLRMRKVESAAQGVTKLVMKAHRHGA